MAGISAKTIGRLSLYRRLLAQEKESGRGTICSHELAVLARGTPAQVRRDLMAIGSNGRPSRGYDIKSLIKGIDALLDAPVSETVALVGVGNLGRAIVDYLSGRRPKLQIVAAFDNDPAKTGTLINGCPCYAIDQAQHVIQQQQIRVAIVAVPAHAAQTVAEQLVNAGIRGLLNFAPVRLHLPKDIFTEDIDISMAIEKAAFFARQADDIKLS